MNHQAFGGMLALPNFILYRLDWNASKNKYDKHPCSLDGQEWPVSPAKNRTNYTHAVQCLATLPTAGEHCYSLGFWLTEECGYFLFDLDGVIIDGELTENARGMTNYFAGALVEYSSSNRGLHIIGRRGALPDHCNRNTQLNYEFYIRDRGIAIGHDAIGSADFDCTAQLLALLPTYFPPREKHDGASIRRSDWRGPEDDDVLIERFLNARQSAEVLLGGKLGIRDLWAGVNIPEDGRTEADMALASHLAFWTGCDGDRIERLMRRSGLKREKWDTHRTYLRELTIDNACASCTAVYQEPVRDTSAMQRELGISNPLTITTTPSDMGDRVKQLLMEVSDCGTFDALTQELIPRIASCNIPLIMAERLVQAVNKKLDIFDAKMPVGRLRTLLCPPIVRSSAMDNVPDWVHRYCYVSKTDKFYDMQSGVELTAQGFHAINARLMPERQNGERENPAKWCLERWNMVTVDDIMYHPSQPQFFEWAGTQYVNSFMPSSVPAVSPYSADTVEAINRFQQHLYLLCGKRDSVYTALLQWMAYGAKNPGAKIKWSPLIKGVPGDGKSIVGDVMAAALGERNVKITSPGTLSNSGGFTDWTIGACFNMIEEVHMEGDTRHALFNSIKIYIDAYKVDVNSKGRKGFNIPNVTNHLMLSNYADAAPTDENDRRLMTIFSPYNNADECAIDRGLGSRDDLPAYFRFIGDSCRRDPGQWRAWLLSVDTSTFDASGRAPWTEERARMAATGSNPWDTFVADIIEKGGMGIHKNAFSSSRLNAQAKLQAELMCVDMPRTSAWSHTLVRLGYTQLAKPIWWNGATHRIWCKAGSENSVISILDSTLTSSLQAGSNL